MPSNALKCDISHFQLKWQKDIYKDKEMSSYRNQASSQIQSSLLGQHMSKGI